MSTPLLPAEDDVRDESAERQVVTAPPRRLRSRSAWTRQFFIAGVLSFLWACLCNATIDVLQAGGNLERLVKYELPDTPVIFLLSSTVVWLVWGLVFALVGRYFLTGALVLSAAVVAGFANYEKLRVRGEPILPSDIGFASNPGFLGDVVARSTVVAVIVLIFLVVLIAVLLGRVVRPTFPRVTRRRFPGMWRRWILVRVVIGVVCASLLVYVSNFNQGDNAARGAYERAGAHWAFWFQKVNYLRHGVVAGFLYNMPTDPMEMPEGYSRERMDQLATKYEGLATAMNRRGGGQQSVDDLNVVVVLSESFADPTQIPGVELERDPIPFTRALMADNPSGSLLAQHFGGGTANMEYEALTGLSISQFAPQHDTPYSMSVFDQDSYPSVIGYLKARGHRATGIHPYMPTMYKRQGAYRALGFDEFVSEDDLHEQRRIDNAQFIADSSAFKETLLRMKESTGPDVVNLVTMQNHYPTDDVYDDPLQVSGVEDDVVDPLGNFARGLEHSDEALKSFLAELKAWDEPTAVVFYGDHQPALWGEDAEISANQQLMHQAPFVLWSNTKDLPAQKAPLVSPIQFMPMLFQGMGVDLPPFYALLAQLDEHVSAMENGEYYSPSGALLEDPESDPATAELLEDYRLVEYDLAVGERYSLDRMFPQ